MASTVARSRFSFSTRSGGRPAGANRPYHASSCSPGRPASAVVGTSGSAASRCGEATA
ncbi:Uncharacterised protein [Bordetella pertussis]|nr:Uncharacterised protein [Bordetella pertussis]